jgi:translocator protein
MPPRSAVRSAGALAGFLAACFAVSTLGALSTASGVDTWYPTLAKPPFNPPAWVFGPVWTTLYVMIAVAGWRVWRRVGFSDRRAFALYGLQLALNLMWSVVFFGLREIGAAFLELVLLWAAIAANAAAFRKHDRIAGLLLLPYLAWVSFAGVLNAAIWMLN